jgi:hypothetical protein
MQMPWITGFTKTITGDGAAASYTDQTICTFLILKGLFSLTLNSCSE